MPPERQATRDSSPPLRILLVEPAGFGGVSQHAHNLANALALDGHAVALATRVGFETRSFPRAYDALEVFDRFRPRPVAWASFAAFVRRFRPHVVHIDGAVHPGCYFAIWLGLRALTRARFVYTAQDVMSKKPKPYHPWVLRRIYRGMDHVLVNLEQNRRFIMDTFGVAGGRVTTIPTGDLLAFVRDGRAARGGEAAAGHPPQALFFGFIEPRKGIGVLIKAFAAVRAAVPAARLRIVGPCAGPTAAYREEIARLALQDCVTIEEGYVPFEAIPGLFADCDVVVLPYESGWSSGVVLSAYGFGKPVIATTIGGLPELVHEGRTGYLTPPGDADALAAAMVRMLGNPAVPAAMAVHVAAEARQTSWEQVAGRTAAVYRGLLGRQEPERA